jgi:hypothetical protein
MWLNDADARQGAGRTLVRFWTVKGVPQSADTAIESDGSSSPMPPPRDL